MNEISSKKGLVERPRLSLEQKLMLIVRRYRAAEKRRKQKEAARSKRLRMVRFSSSQSSSFHAWPSSLAPALPAGQAGINQTDGAPAFGHYAKLAQEYEQIAVRRLLPTLLFKGNLEKMRRVAPGMIEGFGGLFQRVIRWRSKPTKRNLWRWGFQWRNPAGGQINEILCQNGGGRCHRGIVQMVRPGSRISQVIESPWVATDHPGRHRDC